MTRPAAVRRIAFAWAALAAGSLALSSALPARAAPEWTPTVRYDLDAALDASAHVVTGSGTVVWRSDAQVPVGNLRFHLYLNAFRDAKSTFQRERKGQPRAKPFDPEDAGSIEVTRLRVRGGADLLPGATFVSPDDGNRDDATLLDVPLPAPVPRGGEVALDVAWTARLPRVTARTGWGGDFHMVAQWFPKLGVWEDVGEGGATEAGWNCHQFHAQSEFFADFGTYDVRVRVPAAYEGKVGGTGERLGVSTNADGTLTYVFRAERVHDFAWVCGERFDVHVFRFAGKDGGDPGEAARVVEILRGAGRRDATLADVALKPVDVTILLQPEHAGQLERHRRAVFAALTYMGLWFGPYPYPTLTVVDPDARARGAGGMEYPTLITGGTDYVVAEEGIDPEFVLVHEFGHQHFYGLLASNEFEDAWLDEGLTTYATAKTLAKAFPPMPTLTWYAGLPVAGEPPLAFPGVQAALGRAIPRGALDVPWGRIGLVRAISRTFDVDPPDTLGVWPAFGAVSPLAWLRDVPPLTHLDVPPRSVAEHERARYAESPDTDALVHRHAWHYLDGRAYGTNSYRRTANLLRTLEGYLGEDVMLLLLRTYAERFRFAHPTPEDFFRTADEVAKAKGFESLGWFFDEFARGSGVLDFGVHAIENGEKGADGLVPSKVVVRRFGDARFPTRVRVSFEGGASRDLVWGLDDRVRPADGGAFVATETPPEDRQYRWVRLLFRAPSRVVAAETDPGRLVSLDVDRTNDGRRADPDRRASVRVAMKALGWIEMMTSFYGGL
jgi:hypothetical protein